MKVEMQLGSEKLSIETGKVAKQADGAVWVLNTVERLS